jgi:glycine hydroxymethyltransferase
MSDFLFRGTLADLDPDVYELTQLEAERQARKIILVPSESQAPLSVREAMASAFQNIYAEGYPNKAFQRMTQEEILDYPIRLTDFRRYSDPRFYKGTEYADIIESLAKRRCAEAFAANNVKPEQIYVNVQALSGAPANNAVYHALIQSGDTVMGMDLFHGGHLTHGSPANRSGQNYHIVSYKVDPHNEQINYDDVMTLAKENKPKMIICGYSSYPWIPDWKKFRQIADAAGAFLLADISHIGGLVAAGVVPSPIGYAHVITSTTHKTLGGPRGAIIMSTDPELAKKIDRAVFPGEQGGPHVQIFAALALTFKLARTKEFESLQKQTIKNALAISEHLKERGLRIPYGGTNSHMLNVDVSTIKGQDGTSLSGDYAARILDVAGIVVNRNTIPGDKYALDPSGIRLGTPWITQRGFDEKKSIEVADILADVLLASTPHTTFAPRGKNQRRAKIDFKILNDARARVRDLANSSGLDFKPASHDYPHFYYLDDKSKTGVYELVGEEVRQFLDYLLTSDLSDLKRSMSQPTGIITPFGEVVGTITCVNWNHFRLTLPISEANMVATWIRDLSDSYISFNMEGTPDNTPSRMPGPIVVQESQEKPANASGEHISPVKPYFIGSESPQLQGKQVDKSLEYLPDFTWTPSETTLRHTPLYDVHKEMGAKIILFAGWEMPVWYSSVLEEHMATRQAAGLFDVSHMGVYQVEGEEAASFLDSVAANNCGTLLPGESLYSQFLTPDARVIDDTLIYRRSWDKFLLVVNASNDDKDRAWLESVRDGKVKVDKARPWARTYGYNAILRDLRNPKAGNDMRVDIALQGPKSLDILLAMGVNAEMRRRITALKRTNLCDAVVGGFDVIVSRTGYTGERMAFELFVHPERAVPFWHAILKAGEKYGVKPVGLGARDSLRTEAGLPLYGHEMGDGSGKGGQPDLGVGESGFGAYVKTSKPWFIGRQAYIERELTRKGVVVRFRFPEKGVRIAHNGDPLLDKRGRVIGWVTSCAADMEGTLTGQAFVELKYAVEGTPIYVYQSAPEEAGMAPAEMKLGDKTLLPTEVFVISRFPIL